MKAFFSILLLFVCGLINATDFDVDNLHYVVLPGESNEVEVSLPGGNTSNNVVIPSMVGHNGIAYHVTTIAERGFNSSKLHYITIPPSITEIKSYAFRWAQNLKGVKIDDMSAWCSITFWNEGSNPLMNAGDLYLNEVLVKDLVIPDGITSITHGAFFCCKSLRSVVIPDNVKAIGRRVFEGCSNLESVEIGNNVETIGEGAFSSCWSLKELFIPKSVTFIETELLWQTDLSSIVVDSENPYYDSRNNCNAIIYTPQNILLNGCKNTVIPDGVVRIEEKAFFGNPSLKSIVIPASVETIGKMAFDQCYNLETISLPNLQYIDFVGSISSIKDINVMFKDEEDFLNYISRYDLSWVFYQQSFDRTPHHLYINGELLTEVNLPASVTRIGSSAFRLCTDINKVTISNAVKEIEQEVFSGCSNIESVTISPSVSDIGGCAFYGCTSLNEVNISNLTAWCNINFDVSDTGYNAESNPLTYAHKLYLNGKEIESLVIPDDVTSIKDVSFIGANFNSIKLHDGVTSIGRGAFKDCKSLNIIDFGSSLSTIDDYAFNGCEALTSLVIPESVKNINRYAFYGCNGLEYVDIGNGVETIGGLAFFSSYQLKTLVFGTSLRNVGQQAFFSSNSMNSVICTAPIPPTLNSGTFYNVKNTTLYVPSDLIETYELSYWPKFKEILPLEALGIKKNEIGSNAPTQIYNINGERMSSLRPGINIVNGRKILVE